MRDPGHPTSRALADLTRGHGSRLIAVQYDAAIEQSAAKAVSELQEGHGIDHLDIVVANAGIANDFALVKDVKMAEIKEHVQVNILGVVSLYQATRALLQKSAKPIFAAVGSLTGSLG